MLMRIRATQIVGRIGFYFDDMFGTFTIMNFVDDYDNPWFIANEVLNKLGYTNIGSTFNTNNIIKVFDTNNTSVLLFRQNMVEETINKKYLDIPPRGLIIIDKITFLKILNYRRKKNLK